MKRVEFKECVKLAVTATELPAYLSTEMSAAIGGCATDNARRFVTRAQVASLVRGHCLTLAGAWDWTELAELETLARRFDLVD